jgi:recombination protein RecA
MPLRFPRYNIEDDAPREGNVKLIRKVVKGIVKAHKKEGREDLATATLEESIFSQPRGYIPSGIVPIDCTVCYGLGWPVAIVEIYGGNATGKTAILEHTLAESQRRGYYTAIIPMEPTITQKRAKVAGIDDELLVILDCETIEDVFEEIKKFVKLIRKKDEKTPIVIGWDSVSATPTRTELEHEGGLEASDMGKMAAQMSKMFRRLTRFLFYNTVCLLCTNQTRSNIAKMYGSKETTSGGAALSFYASVRCRLNKMKDIKGERDEIIGALLQLECKKNKVAPPFKHCLFPLYWSKGIDNALAVWEYCVDKRIFKKKGSAYKFDGRILARRSFPHYYRKHKPEMDALLRNVACRVPKERE